MLRCIGCLLVCVTLCEAAESAGEEHLLILRSEALEIGLMPQAGGRIVLLRPMGGENLLLSDPSLWTDDSPPMEFDPEIPAYNGHEMWVGPQRQWWQHQTVAPEMKALGKDWPPDPWITLGRCEVIRQDRQSIHLRWPISPVCGLQFERFIKISDNHVTLRTVATNKRDEAVSWDLWSLTRLPLPARVYAPQKQGWSSLRMSLFAEDLGKVEMMPYRVGDGLFYFTPTPGSNQAGKAFLTANGDWIAGFYAGHCLVISQPPVDGGSIHPEQARIELYLRNSPNGGLHELEFHGPYTSIAPGDSLCMDETWTILPYGGPDNFQAHRTFLGASGLKLRGMANR